MPLDLAFTLSDIDRTAWCIIISEQSGPVRYNFDRGAFDEVKD